MLMKKKTKPKKKTVENKFSLLLLFENKMLCSMQIHQSCKYYEEEEEERKNNQKQVFWLNVIVL